jgi:hypothetical protein
VMNGQSCRHADDKRRSAGEPDDAAEIVRR